MVYLKSVENVITLGKLIGLLFLFCLPLLSILLLKTKRNDLARPVMGTIFLVSNWASEASPTLGCSIEISRDIYMYIYSILHILTIVFHGTRTVEYQPIFHGVT